MADKVLVTYASKHGATKEIAERIGGVLRESNIDVELRDVKEAGEPSGYKAVILGSAAYMGRWRGDAVKYLKNNCTQLAARPTWLFMSGPSGKGEPTELLKGVIYPPSMQPVIDAVKPRDVKPFHGNTSSDQFGGWESWIVKRVGGEVGDFRDWDMITGWAQTIAGELKK